MKSTAICFFRSFTQNIHIHFKGRIRTMFRNELCSKFSMTPKTHNFLVEPFICRKRHQANHSFRIHIYFHSVIHFCYFLFANSHTRISTTEQTSHCKIVYILIGYLVIAILLMKFERKNSALILFVGNLEKFNVRWMRSNFNVSEKEFELVMFS